MRIEIEPGATIARHTHPGVDSGYVAEGGTELTIEGQGALKLAAGDGFQVPTGVPHGGVNGPARLSSSRPMWSKRASRSLPRLA